jgi:hypothetical protein
MLFKHTAKFNFFWLVLFKKSPRWHHPCLLPFIVVAEYQAVALNVDTVAGVALESIVRAMPRILDKKLLAFFVVNKYQSISLDDVGDAHDDFLFEVEVVSGKSGLKQFASVRVKRVL